LVFAIFYCSISQLAQTLKIQFVFHSSKLMRLAK